MEIMILCKVVDNYGDIGFVYRLSRSITELYPDAKLNLVVSDLASFAAMAPLVRVDQKRQGLYFWQIFDWNAKDVCLEEFSKNIPELILECFQCGRPDWLEEILFAPEQKKTVRIINIEYLTAESWADDFHLLKSGTRSILVKKVNFMPGFTSKTGGLVLDRSFMLAKKNRKSALSLFKEKSALKEELYPLIQALKSRHTFCITVFSYRRDFFPLVRALKSFMEERKKTDPLFRVHVFAAPGLSFDPFVEAFEKEGSPFELTALPYLCQEAWDALLCASDFNFVRGEDSFSRACLCGKPFVWHAYEQDEELHLVKVRALLERIKVFLEDEALYEDVKDYFLLYNKRFCKESGKEEVLLVRLLEHYGELEKAMQGFAQSLIQNGNLTEHLMQYIRSLFTQ